MTYNIESKSLVDIVLYYIYFRTFTFITTVILIVILGYFIKQAINWYKSNAKNYFEWIASSNINKAKIDKLIIENEIDKRVHRLDELKRIETSIRMEIDKISEIKAEKDK